MTREALGKSQELGAFGSPNLLPENATTSEVNGSVTLWNRVQDQTRTLLQLQENWDGEGAPRIAPELVQSALQLICQLQADHYSPPQDVYPLPDGYIVLEWQHPNGIIERIEVEGVGRGQLMVTRPDAPATFSDLTWPTTGDRETSTISGLTFSPLQHDGQ